MTQQVGCCIASTHCVGSCTCDQGVQVERLVGERLRNDFGHVVYTLVPLSSSSVISCRLIGGGPGGDG